MGQERLEIDTKFAVGWLSKIADSEALKEKYIYPNGVRVSKGAFGPRPGRDFGPFYGSSAWRYSASADREPGLLCPQGDTTPWFAARRPVEWLEIPLGSPSKYAKSEAFRVKLFLPWISQR